MNETPQKLPHRADLDQIFAMLLPRAKSLLEKSDRGFYPIGAGLDRNGDLHAAMAVSSETLQPNDMMDRMVADFRREAQNGRLVACGVSFDAQIERADGTQGDAIATWLEHASGESVVIYLPYKRRGPHIFEFAGLIAADAPRRVWPG